MIRSATGSHARTTSKLLSRNTGLWTLQAVLALFFIAGSGAPKLLLPTESLPMPIPLPAAMVLFIGTCEVLGGLGLILPGLTGVRRGLTPLAAAALAVLTVCAATYQVLAHQPESAVFALVIGGLAATVACGRSRPAGDRA